jgi:hypothetical protein
VNAEFQLRLFNQSRKPNSFGAFSLQRNEGVPKETPNVFSGSWMISQPLTLTLTNSAIPNRTQHVKRPHNRSRMNVECQIKLFDQSHVFRFLAHLCCSLTKACQKKLQTCSLVAGSLASPCP